MERCHPLVRPIVLTGVRSIERLSDNMIVDLRERISLDLFGGGTMQSKQAQTTDLRGKVAIVTGASSGIGEAI